MTRLAQVIMMLALTTLWVPSAGASWAFCQRSGVVHPAGAECGCEAQGAVGCCDCSGGGEHNGRHEGDCCIAGGKMLPDALLPVSGNQVPELAIAPSPCDAGWAGTLVRSTASAVHVCCLRGPPADLELFLVKRSQRL